jgi:transcriptional regulator with XRE-family HTH domain
VSRLKLAKKRTVMTDIKITDIHNHPHVYPRAKMSTEAIERYTDLVDVGIELPPIEVARVSPTEHSDNKPYLLIDGAHRLEAYKAHGIEMVHAIVTPERFFLPADILELSLRAYHTNSKHGVPMEEPDTREIAIRIALANPDLTVEQIAKKIGRSERTVARWTENIRARRNSQRKGHLVKMGILGMTQKQMAEALGIDQSTVSKIMKNSHFPKLADIHKLLSDGREWAYIAEHYSTDIPTVMGIYAEQLSDHRRFELAEWPLNASNVQSSASLDDRFGDPWPGRIPAQLVAHTLYFFTQEGERVMDPMAGGGVVPDVCTLMHRRCDAFDLVARPSRPEIRQHHWQLHSMRWPDTRQPDLIFFDPPYFSKMAGDYHEDAISSLSASDYMAFFGEFFSLANAHMERGGRIAFLNSDWYDLNGRKSALQSNDHLNITSIDYANALIKAGWDISRLIDFPVPNTQVNPAQHARYQEDRQLASLRRTLIVARK